MERDRTLEQFLLAMRLTTAVFMLVRAVDKILKPKSAQGIFATFYFWKDAPANMLMMFGIAQTIIILAFAVGESAPAARPHHAQPPAGAFASSRLPITACERQRCTIW